MNAVVFVPKLVKATCQAALAAALLWCASTASLLAQTQTANSSPASTVTTQSVFLARCESATPIANWGIGINRQTQPFSKEPAWSGRKISRGSLLLGGSSDQAMPFVWDYTQGKLYLDLNRNRDLTDDAAGVFSVPLPRFSGYYYQTFTNVQVTFKTPEGDYPVTMDLSLFNPSGQPMVTANCRSYWSGRISLRGRDLQVGLVEAHLNIVGSSEGGFLLVRPWERRDQPFNTQGKSLDAFAFQPNLFLDGQAYRLKAVFTRQQGAPGYQLNFSERPSELGELRLSGKFIQRVMLAETRPKQGRPAYTVILDRPDTLVKIPVGSYNRWQVHLKAGELDAFREGVGTPGDQPLVTVSSQGTNVATLTAGGPLTNLVSLGRRGRLLSLDYRLVGADGARYELALADRSKPPGFVIYRNGKVLDSGKFEFG